MTTKLSIAVAVLTLLIPVVPAKTHRHHICAASQSVEHLSLKCNGGLAAICAKNMISTEDELHCEQYPWFPNEWHFNSWADPEVGGGCMVKDSEKSNGAGNGRWACVYS